ncbi:MAG: NrfD/PsrC family molybdoenzyme membrane anchor subunit [Actinomycetota bacterium]
MAIRVEKLPYGVGRPTSRWYGLAGLLAAVVGVGAYAYSREVMGGLSETGMRDVGTMGGATWGIYIAFVVYFVGVSFAGITVAALIRLANLKALRSISRMAELLTVVSLMLAGLAILADLGQPLRGIVNLFRYARPQSPFFGTFTLVISGYLFASVVYLYLDSRRDAALCAEVPGPLQRFHRWWSAGYHDTPAERQRHDRASFWLAVAILPLLVTAHSTLGFVFGLQIGRPGWFSALQAPAFVILAGVSGVGLLIVVAAGVRRWLGEREQLGEQVFKWLGGLLFFLILAYLYFVVVEVLTAAYTGMENERDVIRALLVGDYAPIFWASVGMLIVPLGLLVTQFLRRRVSIGAMVASGILVNLAAIGKRYLIVVPSQTHGTLLPYGTGTYTPSVTEIGVVAGLLAFGALSYVVFAKVFPVMDIPETEGDRP